MEKYEPLFDEDEPTIDIKIPGKKDKNEDVTVNIRPPKKEYSSDEVTVKYFYTTLDKTCFNYLSREDDFDCSFNIVYG